MTEPPDGEYLLTDVQWRRRDRDRALRPLHGFTTGHLVVEGQDAQVRARFSDQFLSNQFSRLEEYGIPIVLTVAVLEAEDAYTLACPSPELDRAGASYQLKVEGEFSDVEEAPSL